MPLIHSLAPALGAALWGLFCITTSVAQAEDFEAPARQKVKPRFTLSVPYGLEMGKSTLADAEAAWKAATARELTRGQSAVGGDKMLLVDIENVDFYGAPRIVRFAFFSGALYSVQTRLRAYTKENGRYAGLTEDQLLALETSLRDRFGPPTQTTRDAEAVTPKPNNLIWNSGPNRLVLHYGLTSSVLNLMNEPLARKVAEHRKKASGKKGVGSGAAH